jgi:hypothetical protein
MAFVTWVLTHVLARPGAPPSVKTHAAATAPLITKIPGRKGRKHFFFEKKKQKTFGRSFRWS